MCDYSRRDNLIKRIQENCVEIDTGYETPCLIWQGGDSGNGRGGGYGRISINGFTSAVHRVVYTHFFGYIPNKKQIDHKCNQRKCCNPDHLEMVSHLENQKRRIKRSVT